MVRKRFEESVTTIQDITNDKAILPLCEIHHSGIYFPKQPQIFNILFLLLLYINTVSLMRFLNNGVLNFGVSCIH